MDSSGSKKGGTRNEWRPEGETYILTHKKLKPRLQTLNILYKRSFFVSDSSLCVFR